MSLGLELITGLSLTGPAGVNPNPAVEDFESYVAGQVTDSVSLMGGTGWSAPAVLFQPLVGEVAQQPFENPAVASNVVAADITNDGSGWNGAPTLELGFQQITGEEDFESYSVASGVSASSLTGGSGWDGAPTLT